jgi:preprotein translocase subunit SecA
VDDSYEAKVERFGAPLMRQIEREIVLRNLDSHWREHLAAMDYLRQGIHLRGYAQKDYRYEFKREAFELFTAMLGRVKFESAAMLAKVEVRDEAQVEREEAEQRERLMRALQAQHAEAQSLLTAESAAQLAEDGAADIGGVLAPAQDERAAPAPFVRNVPKVGRNDACPCGSGKKYKQCHGQLA